MPSKPPRKAPPTAPGRPAARPRPLPGVSTKGLPPGSPYACNAPEVGRQVAGDKYAGRVVGCATPPAGKRGTYLAIGDAVARSTVTRDLDKKARRKWFAEGGAGAAEPLRGRSKPEPEAGRQRTQVAPDGEAPLPATVDEVRSRVAAVQRALGWTGQHSEAQVEVSRRGGSVHLRIDDAADRAPSEREAIAKAWPRYLRRLRDGVHASETALRKSLGQGPTPARRATDEEVALMRRRLQQAADALAAASAATPLVRRESFGPGTADARRPKPPPAPRFGAGTADDARQGPREGDPVFPDAFVAYAVRRLGTESFAKAGVLEAANPPRKFVQLWKGGKVWLARAADGVVTARVGTMVERESNPTTGEVYASPAARPKGVFTVITTAFKPDHSGLTRAAPRATLAQAYETAVAALSELGLPMRRPAGLPWFDGAHAFEPKRGRSKPEPEQRRDSALDAKEVKYLGYLLGRSAGEEHVHRMAGVVPLRLVRVGEKRALAYEFAYVHDGVSEGFILPEGVMLGFKTPPPAMGVYMMPVLGHNGRVFKPIPELPTIRSLLYADKPMSYDTRVVHDWQRTLAEYMAKPGAERRGTNRGGRLDAERGVWRSAVIHALRHRWPVPARVLADLPGAAQLFGFAGETAAPEAAALEGAVDVTVGHSSEGGTYVVTPPGDLRFNAALKALHMGFKWWEKGQRWYRGGSIGQAAPSVDLEQIANALRVAGARVRVEGVQHVDPAQARAAFAQHKAANAEKSSARAVDLLAKIDELNREADAAETNSHTANTFRRREMAASKAARLRKEAEGLALKVRELAGRSVRVARDAASGGAVAQIDRAEMNEVAKRGDAAYRETRDKRDGAAGRKVAVRAAVESTGGKDFFATPPALARFMVDVARVAPGRVVVEPSAGMGAIVDAALAAGATRVVAVELDRARVAYLSGRYDARVEVVEADFAHLPTASLPSGGSVLFVMNPPFTTHDDVKAYVAHITRAADAVDRGMCWGLVALAPASLLFGADKRTAALRSRIEAKGGTVEKLPAGAFKASGTAVNAVLVRYGRVAPQSEVPPFAG